MKSRLLIICCLWAIQVGAQNFFTTVYTGISSYQGDLVAKAIDPVQARPAAGIGLQYELNHAWSLRADFTYGKITGNDKYSLVNKHRNLSFESNIGEFFLGVEYTPINLYEYKVSPYFFTGIGRFKFNPYAYAKNGSRVTLTEFDTEGQGFYQDRKPYKLRQFSVPLGAGMLWAVTDNFRVGFVVGFRKTFTDYIDDVSTTYIDADILVRNRGSNALNYAFRAKELDPGLSYPADGTPRGNPKTKDWYQFSGLTVRFRIASYREKKEQKQYRDRGRTDCPKLR